MNTEVDSSRSTPVAPSRSISPRSTGPSASSSHISMEHHQRRNKRQRVNREEEIDNAIYEGLRDSRRRWEEKKEREKQRKESEVAEKNPDMSFGRHVGERLSRMAPYQKAIAQVRIQQILLDVEFPSDQLHQQSIH